MTRWYLAYWYRQEPSETFRPGGAGNGRSDPSDDNGDGRGVSPFVTDIRDSVTPLPEDPT